MQLADRSGLAQLGGRRAPSTTCCSSATRWPPLAAPARCRVGAGEPAPRPAVPGQGDDRGLPRDVHDGGERPRVPLLASATTSASARCTTGTPTAGTRTRRRSRCATSSCSTAWNVLADVGTVRRAPQPAARPRRVEDHGPRSAPRRAHGRGRARAPADGLEWGRRVGTGRGRTGCAVAVDRRHRGAHAAAHHHLAASSTAS